MIDTIAPFKRSRGPDISDDGQYYGSYVAALCRALRRVPPEEREDFTQAYWVEVAAMRDRHDPDRVNPDHRSCAIKGLATRSVYRARYHAKRSSVPRPSLTTIFKAKTDPKKVSEETLIHLETADQSFSLDAIDGGERLAPRARPTALDLYALGEALESLNDRDRDIMTRKLNGEDERAIARALDLSHQAINLRVRVAIDYLRARAEYPQLVRDYKDVVKIAPLGDDALDALRRIDTPTQIRYRGAVHVLVKRGLVTKTPNRPGHFERTEAGHIRLEMEENK